jgi:2-keto-4-pentenoate hydratase/2-oxohepta-3-ene-1,7-dioic acid hydratase in catechol pathway
MEILGRLGVADELYATALLGAGVSFYTKLTGHRLGGFSGADFPDYVTSVLSSTPRPGCISSQIVLEAILKKHADDNPLIRVLFNHEKTALEQDESRVRTTILDRDSGESMIVESAYVIACDGVHSSTREELGATMLGPPPLPDFAHDQVDYEVELAVVIGRGGSRIAEADAMRHVVGYTLANDVSARDIQMKAMTGQEFTLTHAKGLDGFKPLGPALVTADEFDDPIDIHIETRVNGEIRQDARTNDFVHSIPRCISYVSGYMRLDPGDVILTGSPAGVGFFQGIFLKAGDVVEMTADRIGTLRNSIIDA